MVRYGLPPPRFRFDAIRQGAGVAEQERRRLGLGDTPVGDIAELLERQGLRTALVDLPEDVSGLTLVDREAGPFVAANRAEHVLRRTFSFAHEYAHVLLDCEARGVISRGATRADLVEVRANAFAANFLMPERGVRHLLATLGKAGGSRLLAETPTTREEAVALEARAVPAVQEIQLHDVAALAHYFGVSRTVALYRLRNLQLLSERELKALLDQEHAGRGRELACLLGLREPDHVGKRNRFGRRFLGLALEAFTREAISRAKLEELFALVLERPRAEIAGEVLALVGEDEPTGASIPAA
jgi:Zn-dependent peptidase ImmA (M78 family)